MQAVGLGHAWRCHNQLEDDMGDPVEPIAMETTIMDLIEQNHKLTRERAAAENHLTCILALSRMFAKCKAKLARLRNRSQKASENYDKLTMYEGRISSSLFTEEIMMNHGYTTSSC